MVTIAACQELHQDWLKNLAGATGGRTFSTHESEWVWLPARRQLVLLYPQRIAPAGIRPGLAEGMRLGAQSVSVWLNNAVSYAPLEAFGFRRGPQPLWMSAPVSAPQQYSAAAAAIDPEPAEVSGPDAEELAAGRGHPRTAWHVTTRSEGQLTGRAWVFVPSQQAQQEQRRLRDAAEQRRQQDRAAAAGRPVSHGARSSRSRASTAVTPIDGVQENPCPTLPPSLTTHTSMTPTSRTFGPHGRVNGTRRTRVEMLLIRPVIQPAPCPGRG